jgi:hypothetical protein
VESAVHPRSPLSVLFRLDGQRTGKGSDAVSCGEKSVIQCCGYRLAKFFTSVKDYLQRHYEPSGKYGFIRSVKLFVDITNPFVYNP